MKFDAVFTMIITFQYLHLFLPSINIKIWKERNDAVFSSSSFSQMKSPPTPNKIPCCCCQVASALSYSLPPVDSTVCGILQARILECVAVPSPGDLPNLRIELRSPALQADSLPAKSHSQFLEVTVSCPLTLPHTSHNKEAAF